MGGLESDIYWLNWLHPALYDPVIVERDLSHLKSMGINLFAAVGADIDIVKDKRRLRNLKDFLYRAKKHNQKVFLFLSGAHPLNFQEKSVFRLIKEAKLSSLPVIFAYDIAWEPGEWRRVQYFWIEWDLDANPAKTWDIYAPQYLNVVQSGKIGLSVHMTA